MARLRDGKPILLILVAFFVLVVMTPFTLHYMGVVDLLNPAGVAAEWEVHDENGVLIKGASAPRNIFGGVALDSRRISGSIPLDDSMTLVMRPVLIYPKPASSISLAYTISLVLDDQLIDLESSTLTGDWDGGELGLTLFAVKPSQIASMIPEGHRAVLRLQLENLQGSILHPDGSVKQVDQNTPITILTMTLYRDSAGQLFLETSSGQPFALR